MAENKTTKAAAKKATACKKTTAKSACKKTTKKVVEAPVEAPVEVAAEPVVEAPVAVEAPAAVEATEAAPVLALNVEHVGFRAGDVYQALASAAKALSVSEIAKNANISEVDVLLGAGWLLKEGKVKGGNDSLELA